MGDQLYRAARIVCAPFRYDIIGIENLVEKDSPSIFVSNHLKEVGPIEIMISFPTRLYPWVISEMIDAKEAPAYLLEDFTKPTLGMDGWAGMALSTLISKLSVPLIKGMGGIPVYRRNGALKKTFELSMSLLKDGNDLLVFPEDPSSPADLSTGIRHFLNGFAFLGYLYSQEAQRELSFYPLAVEAASRKIMIGEKEAYDQSIDVLDAMQKLAGRLETKVKEMSASLTAGNHPI